MFVSNAQTNFFLEIYKMLLFLTLLIHVNIAVHCDDRTSEFNPKFITNPNYYYFDPRTYTEDKISISAPIYHTYVILKIRCGGEWCVNGNWNCISNNSNRCYNVEHIIPKNNTIAEIRGCPVDIEGNYIMAYGAWNAVNDYYYGEKAII